MKLISEQNFVEAIINKDEQALVYMLDNYGNLIKSIISKHLRLLPQYHEECFNDVLLAVWSNISQYDSSKSSFKNWLAGVSRFKSLTYVRKHIHETQQHDIDSMLDLADDSDKELLRAEHDEGFEELISSLSEQDKELFRRLYLYDEDMEEISDNMNLSTNVIYNRLSRARKKLRVFLNKKGD